MDSTWRPLKDYIRDHIKPGGREKCYVDSYDASELEQAIKTQQQVIHYQTTHKYLYQILILVCDFVDDPSFTRTSQLLHLLYLRGRHYMISTITTTQVYKGVSPLVRNNLTHLFVYRLRNYGDLEAIVEEMSAMYDKNTILQIYHEAIDEPYSSLYINLMEKPKSYVYE